MELGGLSQGAQYDCFDVHGKLDLAGALRVSLINGYVPEFGDSFDILNWTTLAGEFSSLQLPALNGLRWDVSQLHTTGVLAVAPMFEADFDGNGRVEAADRAAWQLGFGSTSAHRADGDATNDGQVDGTDFLIWQRQLGSGASATSSTTVVPEPAAALLAAIAFSPFPRRRTARARGKCGFSSAR
jgi:hypothetical protein